MYLSRTVPDVYSLSNLRLKLAFTCPVYERRSTVQKSPLLDYFCTQRSHLHCHLHTYIPTQSVYKGRTEGKKKILRHTRVTLGLFDPLGSIAYQLCGFCKFT